MPRLAIQLPIYNGSTYLPALLASLRAQTFNDWQLFCCDNSPDPDERQRNKTCLDESGIPFRLIVPEENLGFAGGHNALFVLHNAPFIFVLNQDALLDPTYLEFCLARFEQEPNCASVSGIVYRLDRGAAVLPSMTDETLIDTAGLTYRYLANVVDRFSGLPRSRVARSIQEAQKLFGVSGALAVYRRSAVVSVSSEGLLFEPDFFMYKEDVDLALRLKRKGYEAWLEPSAVAYHERSVKEDAYGIIGRVRAEQKRPAHLREYIYRNQWRLYLSHASWRLGWRDCCLSLIHESMRAVFVFISSPSVFCRTWLRIICELPYALRRRQALKQLGLPFIQFDV